MKLEKIHHIAIIASDFERSKGFYCDILGFSVIAEHFREKDQSWKADLGLNGDYLIELFSFPSSPKRLSYPEACGLRHVAFSVENIDEWVAYLKEKGLFCEYIRCDPYTNQRYVFFFDPDELPIELYEKIRD